MLDDRRVLITGATGTLGRLIARRFWECGANLILVGRSDEGLGGLRATLPSRERQVADLIVADLADPAAPDRIVVRGRTLADRLDVLVNNAADLGPVGAVWENDWEAWQRAFRVDLFAPIALCRLAVDWMSGRGGGHHAKIINLSGGGATRPRPRFTAYGTAKAALVRFSETLAEETRDRRIDVNCVAPGPMNSGLTAAVLDAGPARAGASEYDQARRTVDQGTSADERATALCAFLASADSDGITGKIISAIWDPWETLGEHRDDLGNTDVYTLRRIVPSDRKLSWGNQ